MFLPGQLCVKKKKKKILKAVFKALVSVFHVKVWIEKCQDVTNEHK